MNTYYPGKPTGQQPGEQPNPTGYVYSSFHAANTANMNNYRAVYGPGTGAYYGAPQQTVPLQPVAQAAAPSKKPVSVGRRVLASTALVLACGFCGFGGGMAAVSLSGADAASSPNQTVVYSAPQPATADTGPLPGAGAATGSVRNAAAKAAQSVVSIDTVITATDYFGRQRTGAGAGSGVIISEDGAILTNNHVIEDAQEITVTLADGTAYAATLVGRDAAADVAVLKIDAPGLTPAAIANSDTLQVGDFCLAIGNSLGRLGGTVTDGIISALNREVEIDGHAMHLLQMSAAVSPGNSGGGLFNANGELVGLVNAKTSGEDAEGLGFAIPINEALRIAQGLLAEKTS